jgi:diguanylate cyclase (GGDEF)-like protein
VLSRWREPFFLGWSLSLIAFITVAAGLDAGVRSPIVLMLFLTLVYAALSYPRWAMSVVSAASLLAVLVLSQMRARGAGPTDPTYLGGLMLTLAVTGVMCIQQTRLQQQAREELARVSRSDPLTGALNRLGFGERLDAELARSRRSGVPTGLVLVDFDGFKAINDRDGHAAGDELLRWAVATMRSSLRPGDALARLGGDEFGIVLAGTGRGEADEIAERLRMALGSRISASAGVAATAEDGLDPDALLRRADGRLYAAKRGLRPASSPVLAVGG